MVRSKTEYIEKDTVYPCTLFGTNEPLPNVNVELTISHGDLAEYIDVHCTVVATCPYIDDPGVFPETLVLLLAPTPPYFIVGHYRHSPVPNLLVIDVVRNIVEATNIYQQSGGDI